MKYVTTVGEHTFEIEIEEPGTAVVDGQPHVVDLREIVPGRLYSLLLDHISHESFVESAQGDWGPAQGGSHFRVLLEGELYPVCVHDERAIRLARGMAGFVPDSGEVRIRAPMPGLIVSLPVKAGQAVRQGEVLVILESMKMDNELRAPRDGTVARLHIEIGDSVEGKQMLVTLV
jgi:biotin carboxyl carrier protein